MNNTPSIQDYLQSCSALIERHLGNIFPEEWNFPSVLRESMFYSLMAGGKRLRPILTLAAAEALGGSAERAVPVACAVEMIHTYSLIHDDLPAMDNDDYRRGKLTNHKVYGEAMAVLAGDALLTHAFYVAAQAARTAGASAEDTLAVIEDLAMLAGARGMVGGQVADMQGEQGLTDLDQLRYIHLHKTSDLIVFALRAGGRIAGATKEQLDGLSVFGSNLGLAFQIQDDILDLIGDERKLGKPTNSDVKGKKVTYPFFIGLEASEREVERLTEEAKQAILAANLPNPHKLLQIADYLMKRDH
ncbi:polyprenyl synthetase family protein [Paenibacillus sp. CECT 9249]|uniref:polyprenyl synthetase family protein n=1 Tax=Paenibacillus sp. CECT 9249 TaxID=2845385 RepID=UPI001E3C78D9|nr:farnesyl diphosphate synthase [Paenibacillus sp. CECT 9249]